MREPYWKKFQVSLPEKQVGPWAIEVLELTEKELGPFGGVSLEEFVRGRSIPPGTYRRLCHHGSVWMSDTPAEIMDHSPAFSAMKMVEAESVLITGLGLGMVVQAAIQHSTVQQVTVVELDPQVIELVGVHYEQLAVLHGVELRLVEADALRWKPPVGETFDVVWHDIWPTICSDNLSEMGTLHRKYGRRSKWQGSWRRAHCERMRREEARSWW